MRMATRTARRNEMSATESKRPRGRPPKPMPEPIPDDPENVARALLTTPPPDRWDYLEKEAKDEG